MGQNITKHFRLISSLGFAPSIASQYIGEEFGAGINEFYIFENIRILSDCHRMSTCESEASERHSNS